MGLKTQTLARWAMTVLDLPLVKLSRSVRYRLTDVQKIIADGSRT